MNETQKNSIISNVLYNTDTEIKTSTNYISCFEKVLTIVHDNILNGITDPTELNTLIQCLPLGEASNITEITGSLTQADLVAFKSTVLKEFQQLQIAYNNLVNLNEVIRTRVCTPSQGFYEINQAGLELPGDTQFAIGLPLPIEFSQLGSNIEGVSEGDALGSHVSLSGDGKRMATVSPTAGDNGYVQVFEYNDNGWTQVGTNIECCVQINPRVSLNLDGSILAIGSPYQSVTPNANDSKGHVRIFRFDCTDWVQLGDHIDGKVPDERSGSYVNLSDNGRKVVIGSPGDSTDTGLVRVFEYKNLSWNQIGNDILGVRDYDEFGTSVSISSNGETIAVGAVFHDTSNGQDNWAGEVRVFEFKCGNWVQVGNSIDGELPGDNSGMTVSLSEDGLRLAIGSPGHTPDPTRTNAGHTRIFEYNGSSWIQLGSDINGEAEYDGVAGFSVSLSGNGGIVAIGAPFNRGGDYDPNDPGLHLEQQPTKGHVRLFQYDGNLWNQIGGDIDGDSPLDFYGEFVSLSKDGRKIAIGGAGYNADRGHVQIYELK